MISLLTGAFRSACMSLGQKGGLVQMFGVRISRFLQFVEIFDNNVMQAAVPISYFAQHQPQAQELLLVHFLDGTPVVVDMWILCNLWHDLSSGDEVARDLVEESGGLRLHRLDFGQRILLNRHSEVVSVLDFWNHETYPHFQKIWVFNKPADDRFYNFNDVADGSVALNRPWRKDHYFCADCVRCFDSCTFRWRLVLVDYRYRWGNVDVQVLVNVIEISFCKLFRCQEGVKLDDLGWKTDHDQLLCLLDQSIFVFLHLKWEPNMIKHATNGNVLFALTSKNICERNRTADSHLYSSRNV